MEVLGKQKLLKLKRKNRGNILLASAIDKLIKDIENAKWKSKEEILASRTDADCVHNEGFYFFDINVHRTMVLIEFSIREEKNINEEGKDEETGTVTVKWVGTHEEYESKFKNNKTTIEKWLRNQGLIN